MRIEKKKKERSGKLSWEIVQYLLLSFAMALFTYAFLYGTASSLGEAYLAGRGIVITEAQSMVFHLWLRSICILAAVPVFLALFLVMLGQRLSYLLSIIRGVEKLEERQMDFHIELEGNDEFTRLADRINMLAQSQLRSSRQERELQREREQLIRSLSHDIRTPLTSLISYSQIVEERGELTREETAAYIRLVREKSLQIKELTDRLLDGKKAKQELVEDVRFLMEQLALQWEEMLEERFSCRIDLEGCGRERALLDIGGLCRIMDNLASNVEKYADTGMPVELAVTTSGRQLCLIQRNGIREGAAGKAESYGLGLASIRQIVRPMGGTVQAGEEKGKFQARIAFHLPDISSDVLEKETDL